MSTLISQLEAELPEYLLCPVCNNFLSDGGFINEHGNTYCGACINSLQGKDPLCQQNFTSIIPNRLASNFAACLLRRELIYSATPKKKLATSFPEKSLLTATDIFTLLDECDTRKLHSMNVNDFSPDIHEADADGNTLLHHIALHWPEHLPVLEYLPPANVNISNREGHTPLHQAVYEPRAKLSELIKRGADINLADSKGRTPLHTLVDHLGRNDQSVDRQGTIDNLHYLLSLRPNLNLFDAKGDNLLHSTIRGNVCGADVCRILIDNGVDLNTADQRCDCTPLILAILHDKLEIAEILLEKGAGIGVVGVGDDIGFANELTSALHTAASLNTLPIANLILRTPGCLVDIRDHRSMTPLHEACKQNLLAMAMLLVQAGADILATAGAAQLCCCKADAFHFALIRSPDICEYLLNLNRYSSKQLRQYAICAIKFINRKSVISMIEASLSVHKQDDH